MDKGHDKGHKGQMSDREVMKLAFEALHQYIEKKLTVGQRYTNEGQQLLDAHAILRQALDHVPDTMKMTEPDMGIDRGAWDDVPDATKWVDELRGGDETEQEPVAWMYVNKDGEVGDIGYGEAFGDTSLTLLYTAPPKREWVGLTDEEIGEAAISAGCDPDFDDGTLVVSVARAIEAKLKEKNT